MTILDDILITMKKLKRKVKENTDQDNWSFIAKEIENWVYHIEAYNVDNETCNNLISKIQYLYNITEGKARMERRFVLEFVDPVLIELIKLTGKK